MRSQADLVDCQGLKDSECSQGAEMHTALPARRDLRDDVQALESSLVQMKVGKHLTYVVVVVVVRLCTLLGGDERVLECCELIASLDCIGRHQRDMERQDVHQTSRE